MESIKDVFYVHERGLMDHGCSHMNQYEPGKTERPRVTSEYSKWPNADSSNDDMLFIWSLHIYSSSLPNSIAWYFLAFLLGFANDAPFFALTGAVGSSEHNLRSHPHIARATT